MSLGFRGLGFIGFRSHTSNSKAFSTEALNPCFPGDELVFQAMSGLSFEV